MLVLEPLQLRAVLHLHHFQFFDTQEDAVDRLLQDLVDFDAMLRDGGNPG